MRRYLILLCGYLCVLQSVAQEVEDATSSTPKPSFANLKEKAAEQCSYRHSTNLYNVTQNECKSCVSERSETESPPDEEAEKTIYRMTFDCRPMRNLKEYLRKLCRSSMLPERSSLDAYASCDECLYKHGVKDNGTTFDEMLNARKSCIRIGHKATVYKTQFAGRLDREVRYSFDYELLRDQLSQKTCNPLFDEKTRTTCFDCFDKLFLWPEYPETKASQQFRKCHFELSFKESQARICQIIQDSRYKDLLVPTTIGECRDCFKDSSITKNSTLEEKLGASFRCVPSANPVRDLQMSICSKFHYQYPMFKKSRDDQPRALCMEWTANLTIPKGCTYEEYKQAHLEVSGKLAAHLQKSCSNDTGENGLESCKTCVASAFASLNATPWNVNRSDIWLALRCVLQSKGASRNSQVPMNPTDPIATETNDQLPSKTENPTESGDVRGPAIKIASDDTS